MSLPVLIIANPVSGSGRGAQLAARLAAELSALGIESKTELTTLDRNGRAIAGEIEPGSVRAIAVVGGDGSINDVIRGVRDPAPPIAQLPAGTANVWAREARIRRRPAAVAQMIAAGRTAAVPLGEANGEPFFLFAGAGYDARLVHAVERRRVQTGHTGGMLQWFRPGWTEFWRPLANLTVHVDGRRLGGNAEVLVTHVRSFAGFMWMPRGIDIEDGALHVLAFPRQSRLRMILLSWRAIWGTLRPDRDVTHVATQGPVRIESAAEEPFHRDGDDAGVLPLDIQLSGRTVRLLRP